MTGWMIRKKILESVVGVLVMASFVFVFIASYFLFRYGVVWGTAVQGGQGELSIGWILLVSVAALLTTVLVSFWFADLIRKALFEYLTGQN
jgi:hypothetical protein